MRKLISARKAQWLDAVLVGLCALLAFACVRLWVAPEEVLSQSTEISYGYIGRSAEGVRYAIDDSHARLIAFDNDANEQFEIVDPSDDGKSALYIDDVYVDEDGLYLAASEWDGMLVARELILAYDTGGDFQRSVYELTYDVAENPTNKHRIYGLHRANAHLVWAECWEDEVRVRCLDLTMGTSVSLWTLPYDNAFNAVADIVFDGYDLIVLNKNGRIERFSSAADSQLLYSTVWSGEGERMPFRLALSEGTVYFTDIRSGSVHKVLSEEQKAETVFEGTDSQTVTFSEDGDEMLLLDSEGLLVVGKAGEERFSELRIPTGTIAKHMSFIACLVLGGVVALLIIVRLVFILRGMRTEGSGAGPLVSIVVALVASGIVGYILVGSFRDQYLVKIREQLQMTASQVSLRITEEELDGVSEATDFGSDSYDSIVTTMEEAMPLDVDFFHTTYCNILRKDAVGEGGHAIAYRDQSIGTYFPLDEVETEELLEVYKTAEPIMNDEILDVSGTYISIKVPILAQDGSVVGVVAVGADTSVVNELINDMEKEVLLSIVLVLLIFWIIATEAMALRSQSATRAEDASAGEVMPSYLIRVLVFVIFAAFNLVSSFLPVYVLRHSSSVGESLGELAGTLPLTINIFAMGVMSLFCATAMRRFGTKRVFVGSMACSLVGNILLFMAAGYPFIVLGLLLDGIGVGMITNAIYVVLTYLPDEETREGAFSTYNGASLSGINFGMILGSILAVNFGQRVVFLMVAVTWVVVMLLGIYVAGRLERLVTRGNDESEEDRASVSIGRFIASRPIWSFILLIQNPYIVFNSFAYYFVPLFCDGAGLQETIVSVLLMLYSQTAVMLGDPVTDRMEKTFGGRSVYLALGLNVAAVALYITTQTLWGLVGALLLLGVSASFAKPCQQSLYLRQDASKRLGEDQAMGIYNFSENIGESLGPIVFGGLMSGPLGYVWAFLGAIGCAGAAHFALNRKEMSREE